MLRKVVCWGLAAVTMTAPTMRAQGPKLPERAVRRDIPMTNIIRRAMAAGTRDSTGRPGRNYWQLLARESGLVNDRKWPAAALCQCQKALHRCLL